eukprot:CAMPEP_0114667718 /NCGR_PEP_ID=MMETSP0191-20121206/35051_1 /TAXON_ID=126664 /ORGANISM="Sorites sp." /LENGTH=205 /DNA_ID=CAMNT_0001919067 /DNA_START=60 /DNA_END=677 /DNA_ORIENTATION=+
MNSGITTVIFSLVLISVMGEPLPAEFSAKSPYTCEICKIVVRAIDNFIKGEENDLEQALERGCRILPSHYLQNACEKIVANNLKEVIDGLLHEQLSPHQICQRYLHQCPNSAEWELLIKESAVESKSQVPCTMCTFMVEEIKNIIKVVEPTVINVIDKVCKRIHPQFFRNECITIVEKDLKQIIDGLVLEHMTTNEICSQLLHTC